MTRNRSRRQAAGFTIVELLVVVAIAGMLLGIAVPALVRQIGRSQLIAAARETAVLMQRARMEAIRHSVPVIVAPDPDGRVLTAWVNSARDANELFTDLRSTPPPASCGSARCARAVIVMRGFADAAVYGADSEVLVHCTAVAAPSRQFVGSLPIAAAVFMPNGSVLVEGAYRFSEETARNFLEVRVAPRGTARIVVRKYNPSGPVAGELWYESGLTAGSGPGSGRNVWEWY